MHAPIHVNFCLSLSLRGASLLRQVAKNFEPHERERERERPIAFFSRRPSGPPPPSQPPPRFRYPLYTKVGWESDKKVREPVEIPGALLFIPFSTYYSPPRLNFFGRGAPGNRYKEEARIKGGRWEMDAESAPRNF